MAESLGDKLKRIAAEKKAARELASKITEVTSNGQRSKQPNELGTVCGNEQREVSSGAVEGQQQTAVADDNKLATGSGSEEFNDPVSAIEVNAATGLTRLSDIDSIESAGDTSKGTEIQGTGVEPTSSVDIAERTTSDHPLSMQFAEMEQALLTADPTFKTILRDVHRHLGNDPELVTMMTEEEVQLVVRGLIVHAKAEIIEPAKAKTIKKDIAAAKKKVISADDL